MKKIVLLMLLCISVPVSAEIIIDHVTRGRAGPAVSHPEITLLQFNDPLIRKFMEKYKVYFGMVYLHDLDPKKWKEVKKNQFETRRVGNQYYKKLIKDSDEAVKKYMNKDVVILKYAALGEYDFEKHSFPVSILGIERKNDIWTGHLPIHSWPEGWGNNFLHRIETTFENLPSIDNISMGEKDAEQLVKSQTNKRGRFDSRLLVSVSGTLTEFRMCRKQNDIAGVERYYRIHYEKKSYEMNSYLTFCAKINVKDIDFSPMPEALLK